MRNFDKKRLMVSVLFSTLIMVLILFVKMDIFTLSKYENTVSSQNSISTAVYLLDDTYQRINVTLPDVIPSNIQYKYSFSVSNFKGNQHSDTNLKYRIHIRTTTNMEIEYDLFDNLDIDDPEASSVVLDDDVIQDYHGTHFRHIYTDYNTMLYSENKTDYYTLLISFPASMFPTPTASATPDYHVDSRYSGIAEMIEITVESSQILASDT